MLNWEFCVMVMDPASLAGYGALLSSINLVGRYVDHRLGPSKQSLLAHEQRERHHAEEMEFRRKAARDSEERAAMQAATQEQATYLAKRSKEVEAAWPLKLPPTLYGKSVGQEKIRPLNIAFRPPELPDPKLSAELGRQAEDWLERILNHANHVRDPARPVRLLSGDPWQPNAPRGQTAIDILYGGAPDVPTAVIELIKINDSLHLRTASYGILGPSDADLHPAVHSTEAVNIRNATADIARARAEQIRNSATVAELDSARLRSLGHESANIDILDLEERLGLPLTEHLATNAAQAIDALRIIGPALQFTAIALADFYHFRRHSTSPVLPRVLPHIIARFPDALSVELSNRILADYEHNFTFFVRGHPLESYLLAELALGFAAAGFPVHASARRILNRAISLFLKLAEVSPEQALLSYIAQAKQHADRPFLLAVANVYQLLGETKLYDTLSSAAHALEHSPTIAPELLPNPRGASAPHDPALLRFMGIRDRA